ncbi:PAS domain-containing hybrid sensor histidine kinase/response regulator [Roseateles violae]|uniref:histidine kinase n=1 Tax=Roseateles violae TaxID=3058042 RepID=A0ABT8DSG4_9BURK|nr:PAS domain S-box protein [Pelomonas sp. PFR6]MDN3921266.1 PAS domain S-box protein [Pelomonas sp. PFR6]
MPTDAEPPLPQNASDFQHSEQRFRLLVDSVQDYAIFMLDPEGRVLSWNSGAERLKQYRAEEIIGRSFAEFYPPEAIAAGWPQEELRRAALLGRFEDEGWRLRKDGTRFWANVVLTALRSADGSLLGFGKVTRDLTERRQHEELLRRSEEQFRLLLASVTDYAIFMLDPEGHVLTWNAGAQRIKGYAAEEVLGRSFAIFFTPDDIKAGVPAQELAAALQQGHSRREGWRVKKDGSRFWANAILTPIRDADGSLRGFAKVTRDLTEQRRAEDLERSSRQLHEFIAMLGHELRNPLAPITNAVGILQLSAGLPPAAARAGEIIGRQLGQLTRLVDDLLEVGRLVTGKIALRVGPIDYREVVQLSVEAARPLIEQRRHQLNLLLPQEPLPVFGDATRLSQALQNLLLNAARYTPEGGRIELRVGADEGQVQVVVNDNGVGIAPEAQQRIFELFLQEQEGRPAAQGGLGIGLTLARRLIELHGGSLSVHSEGTGQGSSFTIRIPRRAAGAADGAGAEASGEGAQRTLRVLVVDDNRDSADTVVELLGLLGHHARAAYGALAALAAAIEQKPQLVLLDLDMPDGDGFTVMRQIRSEADGPIYIAAMTGHGQRSDVQRSLAAGFDAHLTKPGSLDQIRALLAGAERLAAD